MSIYYPPFTCRGAVAWWVVCSTPDRTRRTGGSGSSPGRGHWVVFLPGETLYSHSASLYPGVQMGAGKFYAGGSPAMDQNPIQGREEILLVPLYYRNWDKLRLNGPLESHEGSSRLTHYLRRILRVHWTWMEMVIGCLAWLPSPYAWLLETASTLINYIII